MRPWIGTLLAFTVLLCLHAGVSEARNVALNASCTSSIGSTSCPRAIDGIVGPLDGWETAGSTGVWLRIDFDAIYRLTAARLMQLLGLQRTIQYIEMLFKDNKKRTVLLSEGRWLSEKDDLIWEEVSLSPAICSDFAHIQVASVDPGSRPNRGFLEIEFHTSDLDVIWRGVLDPLQLPLATLATCLNERLIVTSDDVIDGSLLMLVSTGPFHTVEVYILATGLAFEFGKFVCATRPAVVMTMDSDVGRMGLGYCLPFCGHLVSCFYEGPHDRHHMFLCTCPYRACNDLAFSFSGDAFTSDLEKVYFEDMHVRILN